MPKTDKDKLVINVSQNTMFGANIHEKWLNAYITKQFISTGNIPADECLGEAKEVIRMQDDGELTLEALIAYFERQFFCRDKRGYQDAAHNVFNYLKSAR